MHDGDATYIENFVAQLECNLSCSFFLEKVRWPDGFVCPRCKGRRGYRMLEYGLTQCASCRYQASVTAGTIFHASHVPLKKWFLAILLMATDKGGISALRLHRLLAVSYKTALLMLRRLRSVMGQRNATAIMEAVNFGMEKILHPKYKDPVQAFFMVKKEENGSDKLCLLAPDNIGLLLQHQHTFPECKDNRHAFIAGAVGLVKQFFLGTYHRTSKKYLQLYLDEYVYRFNWQSPVDTLQMLISDCVATSRLANLKSAPRFRFT